MDASIRQSKTFDDMLYSFRHNTSVLQTDGRTNGAGLAIANKSRVSIRVMS